MNTAYAPGTQLLLRNKFKAIVLKPCSLHRSYGSDGRSFVTVRIFNEDGTSTVDVVHCTASHPVKVD